MKRLAILVHGIGLLHGGVGRLRVLEPFLKASGFDVQEFSYGFVFFFSAIANNKDIAKKLAQQINLAKTEYDEVHVIGHSNGCALMELASGHIRKCDSYSYIAPALESYNAPQNVVNRIHVWFNPEDGVLKLTEIVRHIPQWMFKRLSWGKMGITGYVGHDPRVTNHEVTGYNLNWYEQHSAALIHKNLHCPRIVAAIGNQQQ